MGVTMHRPESFLRRPHTGLLLCAAALLAPAASCAFAEEASELAFGPGDIPRFEVETEFPDMDDLGTLDAAQVEELPGFPRSLNRVTLAHLQGALTLSGECQQQVVIDQDGEVAEEGTDARVEGERVFVLTSCQQGGACAALCPEGFEGMTFESEAELEFLDQQKAEEIRDQLSEASPDAISQIRLRFYELALVQEVGGVSVNGNERLSYFEFGVYDRETDNGTTIIPDGYLDTISATTPQRFELDEHSAFMHDLKAKILAAQAVRFSVIMKLAIPQHQLYEIDVGRSGFRVDMQPEVVVSVLEAAKSQI